MGAFRLLEKLMRDVFPLEVRQACIWSLYTTVTNIFLARFALAHRKGNCDRWPHLLQMTPLLALALPPLTVTTGKAK